MGPEEKSEWDRIHHQNDRTFHLIDGRVLTLRATIRTGRTTRDRSVRWVKIAETRPAGGGS